jgi:hypothetical protein
MMADGDRDDDSIGPETRPVRPGETTDEEATEVNPEHHPDASDVGPPDDEVEDSGANLGQSRPGR